jgi:4-amino-4-deoxy-L-arabinose transferase-like glycosyltransferase
MKQKWLPHLLLVLCVASFITFFHLGSIPLMDPDEPVYAETAREMIQFQDYISPRIYSDFWYDKPPMYYWLVAGAFHLFGSGEFAARFPSALLGVCGAALLYLAGRSLFTNRAALVAALVLATSFEYFYLAKAAVTDITLMFFLTGSLLAFLLKRYHLFYICAALAVVTKGPIGFVFPAGIVFLYLLFTRNLAELKHMKLVSGSLLFMLVALPWYLAMYHYHGTVFTETFLGFHNITRFTTPEHPEGKLWYYYIPVLILGFFPWSAFMVQAVYEAVRSSHRPLVFLTIWAAVVFGFFTVSQTKLVSYILPMYPPLALLVGWYIDRIWSQEDGKAWKTAAFLLTVLIVLLEGALLLTGKTFVPQILAGVEIAAVIFGILVFSVWWTVYKRNFGGFVIANVVTMLLFATVLMTHLFPAAAPSFSVRDLTSQFIQHYDGQSPVYVAKFYRPGVTFYTGIAGDEIYDLDQFAAIPAPQKAYFIVKKKQYQTLSPAKQGKFRLLAEQEDKVLLIQD